MLGLGGELGCAEGNIPLTKLSTVTFHVLVRVVDVLSFSGIVVILGLLISLDL